MGEISVYEIELYLDTIGERGSSGKTILIQARKVAVLITFLSVSSCGICQYDYGGQYNSPVSPQIQQQNYQIMRNMGYTPPPTQAEIQQDLQRKAYEAYQQQQRLTQQQKSVLMVKTLLAEHEKEMKYDTIAKASVKPYHGRFRFSDQNSLEYSSTKSYYNTAFKEISDMLDGKTPINLKRAIYLVENVVIKDQVSYDDYLSKIEELKTYTKGVAKKQGIDFNTYIGKHFAIQRLYSDTTDQAFNYDFNDIYGNQSYAQQFVTKLLFSGTGQCRSMPLGYLLLAEEFEIDAYLAFSPKHSYIMFQHKGIWFNFETTNGCLTTNQWIAGSGYVKAESVQSKTYLDPKDKKEVLAHLLNDLATTYRLQLGYDDFLGEMIDKSLAHFYYMHGVMEKANLESARLDKEIWENGIQTEQDLLNHPELSKQLQDLLNLYAEIDNMGYSEMTDEAYEEWLKSLEEEKQKQDSKQLKIKLEIND
ncbi:hypothetical protein [Parvicella tangerina]|nr:hypothetical protein [Parvicella tangerina]